jgi:hypothetical protein
MNSIHVKHFPVVLEKHSDDGTMLAETGFYSKLVTLW